MVPVPEQAMNFLNGHESHEATTTNLAWDSGARQQADQGRSRQQGERRPYLSAESCTHSAAGKSGSDSHRPKPSAMGRDPVRPADELTPNGQEGRTRDEARCETAREGEFVRWRCGSGARFWRRNSFGWCRQSLVAVGSVALRRSGSSFFVFSSYGLVLHEQPGCLSG